MNQRPQQPSFADSALGYRPATPPKPHIAETNSFFYSLCSIPRAPSSPHPFTFPLLAHASSLLLSLFYLFSKFNGFRPVSFIYLFFFGFISRINQRRALCLTRGFGGPCGRHCRVLTPSGSAGSPPPPFHSLGTNQKTVALSFSPSL
ncbi:hypothetical protein CI102_2362 [Trichoderma harzianum]|nr:hypothetical protein CI102_2362 [Trichoderma harzianum]